jgi:hypothetical protein
MRVNLKNVMILYDYIYHLLQPRFHFIDKTILDSKECTITLAKHWTHQLLTAAPVEINSAERWHNP